MLHAVDLPCPLGLRILREHPHDAAFLLPGADDLEARDVDRWGLIDHLAQRLLRRDEELEEPNGREEAVERRVEPREDESAEAVADEERMLARREAHLRLGRRADPLHAAAVRHHDLLDRRRRVHGHRHDPGHLTHGERHERGARIPKEREQHHDDEHAADEQRASQVRDCRCRQRLTPYVDNRWWLRDCEPSPEEDRRGPWSLRLC